MKRLKLFAVIAAGLLSISSFLAFRTSPPEIIFTSQQENDDFRVIPIDEYEGNLEDLPEGTTKLTKVRVSAKTRISTERTYLRIPNPSKK